MPMPLDVVERWVQAQKTNATQAGDTPIPGQGIYDQQTALANQAYNDSVAQLKMQRDNMYHDYGLLSGGAVDPNNQFGRYQQLLGQEGGQLDQAEENSLQRGIGGHGLGAQQGSQLRFQQAGQNLNFQRDVSNIGQNYAQGLQAATYARTQSGINAKQGLIDNALNNRLFNPAPTTNNSQSLAQNIVAKRISKPARPALRYGPWR